jgi:hypothetical protein
MSKNTDLGNLVNGLFVSSTRNVGVGTTTPANALVVDRGNATASYLQFTAGTTTGVLATDGFEVGIDASGNGIISQQENLPLMVYTNNTERLRITAGGNVSIGTSTSPTYLLEVATASGSQRIRVGTLQNNNNSSTFEAITTAASTTASSAWFRANAGGTMSIGTSTYAKANSDSGNFTNLSSEAQTVAMTITSGGTVLVNTANTFSNEKLRVIGSNAFNGLVRFENNVNQTDVNHGVLMICNTANYAIGNDASIGFSLNRADNTAQDPRASIGCKTSSNLGGDLVFNTRNDSNYAERMRILGNGNVGIGNTTPSTKLHVTGTISSTDIIMSGIGSWAYTTSASWTSYQVGIPFNNLSGGGVYLIRLQWGGDNPYIVYGSFLWMPVQSNGSGTDNEMQVMVSSHIGNNPQIFVKNGSVGGQASSQLLIRLANFAQYAGNLTVTAARLM